MTQAISREFVRAFYATYVTRDAARIAPFLHDDVEWLISGPVDLLDYCGPRHGKAAVLENVTSVVPRFMEIQEFEFDDILIQDDRAAIFTRLHGVQIKTGRMIAYRAAHFMRVRDGKIATLRVLCDSFDAAEQVLGCSIDLTCENEQGEAAARPNMLAI